MTAATGHYARKYGVATAAQGPPLFFGGKVSGKAT